MVSSTVVLTSMQCFDNRLETVDLYFPGTFVSNVISGMTSPSSHAAGAYSMLLCGTELDAILMISCIPIAL